MSPSYLQVFKMKFSQLKLKPILFGSLLVASLTTHAEGGLPAEVVKVQSQELISTINSIGTLKANKSVQLAPELSGRIAEIDFTDGSNVNKGDLLFQLDNSIQLAQVNEAKARVKLSTAEFKRMQKLFKTNAASETDLDSASANLNIYRAQAQSAKAQLDKLAITAPFSGVIGIHDFSVGDYINSGQNLVNLVELDTLKFDFALPETYLSKVQVGQNISITTPAYPGKQYSGTVSAVSPAINEKTRSISVRATINNEAQELRPGLFANVILEVSKNPSALLIPEQALIPMGQQYVIMKVVDGKVTQNPVSIGIRKQSDVEITSGVSIGDVVIIAGQMKLRPGAPVTPLFPEMLQANNQ